MNIITAIDYLKHPQSADDSELKETLAMAIEALEKQIRKYVECPKGWQGVRNTRYYCPNCKELTRQHEAYCHKCGQAVKYPKEVYDKKNNKMVLIKIEEELK